MKTQITYISIIVLLIFSQINLFAGEEIKINHHEKGTLNSSAIEETVFAEAGLELEKWMISYDEFNLGSDCIFEKCLQFESWMLSSKSFSEDFSVFESWMLKPFKTFESGVAVSFERELDFEPWMFKM